MWVANVWRSVCSEFTCYDLLVAEPVRASSAPMPPPAEKQAPCRRLLVAAVAQLSTGKDDHCVAKAALRPLMLRLDPAFDPRTCGFASFNEMLTGCQDLVAVSVGEHDHSVRLTEAGRRLAEDVIAERSDEGATTGVAPTGVDPQAQPQAK